MTKNKTTFDLVREYFPDATDKQYDFILCEYTVFPFCGVELLRKRLSEYKMALDKYRKAKGESKNE